MIPYQPVKLEKSHATVTHTRWQCGSRGQVSGIQ